MSAITEIEIALGQRGFGKTFLASKRVKEFDRVILVDPLAELPSFEQWRAGVEDLKDAPLLDSNWIDSFYDSDISTGEGDRGTQSVTGPFYLAIPVNWDDPIESIEIASEIAITLGDCLIVIDEADLRLGANVNPPMFSKLLHTSRHWGVSVFVTARRASGLPTLIRAVATQIHVFRTVLPLDRKYLREETGTEPPGLNRLDVGERWTFADGHWERLDKRDVVIDRL